MRTLPEAPEIIEAGPIELRAPELAHSAALTEAVRSSLPELKVWMPWATDSYDEAGARANLRSAVAAFVTQADFRYHMFDRSGRLVGSTGLHALKWAVPRCEIGYWVRTDATGNGYAAAAVRALSRVGFEQLGLRRIDIRCDDENLASARVAEKCGYRLEGVLRSYMVGVSGAPRDERVYALTDLADLR